MQVGARFTCSKANSKLPKTVPMVTDSLRGFVDNNGIGQNFCDMNRVPDLAELATRPVFTFPPSISLPQAMACLLYTSPSPRDS